MFTVALLQLLPGQTQLDNLEKGLEACGRARQMGADLALFPEMWSAGYTLPDDPDAWDALAIGPGDAFYRAFAARAKGLDMAIGMTYLQRHAPRPRNTITVFDRHGQPALTYAKVHTCDFEIERHLAAGDDFPVATLDTAGGPVHIGAMICYDREFPESARLLMLGGAEVILVPNACPMEINRLAQLRTRAFENMLGVATANYPLGHPDCNGHSSAFDGMAYGQTQTGVTGWRDTRVIEAGGAEGIYLAAFPIEQMRAYREADIHGNAYRHPAKYGRLVAEDIRPPFVRGDYRK